MIVEKHCAECAATLIKKLYGGEIPMRLTRADVWRLLKERFSAAEIAYLAGVSVEVAAGVMHEAIPKVCREWVKGGGK